MQAASCHARPSAPAAVPPLFFERTPGAASRPVARPYRRREPDQTVLHTVVRGHLETLLEEARRRNDSGIGYPHFIEHEFRRYLDCGILARGFVRLRCPACGFERLVAFSCKGRLCPSCWARRAGDTAAGLVDQVLPEAPYRQWVLTFPWEVRFLLGVDAAFWSEMLTAFLKTLFAWLRRRHRRTGGTGGEPGAVTFLQRFGGSLNLNPHFHSLLPDGVFIQDPDGQAKFLPLPPPTDEDIQHLTARLAKRLGAIARRRLAEAGLQEWDPDRAPLHASAGEALRLPFCQGDHDAPRDKPLCARVDGFSLHAARTVAQDDRDGLERLCRYGLRAPFSQDRLSIDPDGRVRCRLLRPWPTPDGRPDLVLDPVAFLRRLAALVPAPYQNLVRYHGVFANRSRLRPRLPKPTPRHRPDAPCSSTAADPAQRARTKAIEGHPGTQPEVHPPRHRSWARLLKRVLDVDALTCTRCATPMIIVAFLTNPAILRRILDHLGLPATPPPIAPSRRRPDDDDTLPFLDDQDRPNQHCPARPASDTRTTRGPP